ncbi:MAG: hypothetical protein AB7U34_04845 [Novosphingobium sp.]
MVKKNLISYFAYAGANAPTERCRYREGNDKTACSPEDRDQRPVVAQASQEADANRKHDCDGGIGGYFQGLSNAAGLAHESVLAGTAGARELGGVAGFLSRGGITSAAARGVLSSAVGQGIGVATGLQSKFDFAGVAAAGIAAGVSYFARSNTQSLDNFGSSLASNTAGAIANAATRSAINGQSFGDNLMRAMPDVIANTVGNLVADAVAGGPDDQSFLAGGDEDPPTRAELAKIYGPEKADAIFGMFTEGTATKLDANGNLILTPELSSYLTAHAPTADALRGEEAHLLQMARDGSLKAYYDFGYADGDPANRFDTSMTSIGDDRRAAALALQHYKLETSKNCRILS